MSFDYDKLKDKRDNQSYWATTSDLFMVMSLVFLLLYVVAGLRTSTTTIQQNLEFKRVSELNEDLKQQLKVYNTLKENYLETQASDEEMKVYEQLLGKLDVLKDESNEKQEELKQKIKESEAKEQALNQYQQIVRNIINSNMMAKATIKRRSRQLTEVRREKDEIQSKFKDVEENLKKTESKLSVTQRELSNKKKQQEKLVAELAETKNNFKSKLNKLESDFKAKQKQEQKAYEEKLKNQKISAKQREKAMQTFLANQKAKLKSEKEALEEQMNEQEAEYNKKIAGLSGKLKASKGELSKAQARLNARKELAGKIAKAFAKEGISAKVDARTGDVELDFGKEYFDTGKFNLKPGMEKILREAIPVYAKSLFSDKKIAKKLSYVEIIGFASPTYKGKYVNPESMEEKDRKAVDYNLKLSFNRANSIFKYVSNKKKLKYPYQQSLYKLVKVTGRSFLAEKIGQHDRDIASGMSRREFCKLYDCLKAQKVIIKFDLED